MQQVLDKEIPRLKGRERQDKCAYLKNRLVRARQVYRSIIVEIRDLDPEEAESWRARADTYDARLAKLSQDVEWAETAIDKDAVAAQEGKARFTYL